jgi:replicative DNA helicase
MTAKENRILDSSQSHDNDNTESKDSRVEQYAEAQSILATLLSQYARGADPSKIDRNLANLYKVLGVKADSASKPQEGDTSLYIPSGMVDYLSQIEKRKVVKTVGTSLSELDKILGGGLEPQRLMVLLGAPGGGKTTLANQIAYSAAMASRPVLFVSSEEPPFSLLSKTLARIGKIPYSAVLKGHDEWMDTIKKVLQAYQRSMAATRLAYMDVTMGGSLDRIEKGAEQLFEQFKAEGNGILIIDYLQNFARQLMAYRSGKQDIRLAVTEISQRLRTIAASLDCTVIALASQHRASQYDATKNALATGKESGDIEYTADVIMAIGDGSTVERSAPEGFTAKVLRVDKNRQGAAGDTCVIDLNWNGMYQQFTQVFADESASEDVVVDIPASNNGHKKGNRK